MRLSKLICVIAAAFLLFSCSSEQPKESESIPAQPEILTHVYTGEEIVFPEGYIDSANAQDFEETINELRSKGSYDEIELNCGQLQYISSAGLRVILRLRKDVKAVVL